MKKCIPRSSILWVISIICISNSFGQSIQNDSTYLKNALAQTAANYNKSIGQQSRLYNGPEYQNYDRSFKGPALYPPEATTWEQGAVNYDGITYNNVSMMYDIYRDVVVVLLYNKFSMFTLLNHRVHDFTLHDLHFVRVEADSVNASSSGIATGFYQQLYGGKIEVLARRTKTVQSIINPYTNQLENNFISHTGYYIRKGNTYYKIGGESSFLKVLKDKKGQLQQYLSDNKIRFKKDPEAAMAKIASYYDHLNN